MQDRPSKPQPSSSAANRSALSGFKARNRDTAAAAQAGHGQGDASHPAVSQTPSIPDDLVEVARIGEAYGVAGWVHVLPYSEDSVVLKESRVWFVRHTADALRPATPWQALTVAKRKPHAGHYAVLFEGMSNRDHVQGLKGKVVAISRALFPKPAPGEFYWVDMVGLSVVNREGVVLGKVTEVTDHGAHPLLDVQPETGEPFLLPFVPAYIDEVCMPEGVIRVDWQADYL